MKLLHFITMLIFAGNLSAINIDEFEGDYLMTTSSEAVSADSITGEKILGGVRKISLLNLSEHTPDGARVRISNGYLEHTQDARVQSMTQLTWDATPGSNINYQGFSNLDLLSDQATAFELKIMNFDYAYQQDLTIEILVYSSAQQASAMSKVIDRAITQSVIIEFPFDSFTRVLGGEADFKNITAIELIIYGNDYAQDLVIDSLKTNSCQLFPSIGYQVVDVCGICGGNGSSCLDCAGIPNGQATLDSCGVCNGDNQSCSQCQEFDQEHVLSDSDQQFVRQLQLVQKLSGRVNRLKTRYKKYTKNILSDAEKVQLKSWQELWSIPKALQSCDPKIKCQPKSYQQTKEQLRNYALDLNLLGMKLLKKHKDMFKRRLFKNQKEKFEAAYNLTLLHLNRIKTEVSICK